MAVRGVAAAVAILCAASSAAAQTVTGEVSLTGGVSSDQVTVGATQARVFGELPLFRFFAEGTWTSLHGGHESEAFSAAYPYEGPARPMEAYAERLLKSGRFVGSVRAGRFRTPFGIYSASDHAYTGFLRAPLVKYEGYWALSNTFLEHGVNVMGGTSFLQAEATVARPADASDDERRQAGVSTVLRVQAYHGPVVIGVSHLQAPTYGPSEWAHGPLRFTGVDFRWMNAGVQLRGEWLFGSPWEGSTTKGGYVDGLVHRPFMGPLTLVGRIETLDYLTPGAPQFSSRVHGGAVGARIGLLKDLYGQVNVTHRPSEPYGASVTATDVALTYTIRYPK
jgi:hypothetical protein